MLGGFLSVHTEEVVGSSPTPPTQRERKRSVALLDLYCFMLKELFESCVAHCPRNLDD
jgi:hypothetical protein